MYAKHAAAVGEVDRLSPAILSQIDPQAFWSAVLWLHAFIATLQESARIELRPELNLDQNLVDPWKALEPGNVKSNEYLSKSMPASMGLNHQH